MSGNSAREGRATIAQNMIHYITKSGNRSGSAWGMLSQDSDGTFRHAADFTLDEVPQPATIFCVRVVGSAALVVYQTKAPDGHLEYGLVFREREGSTAQVRRWSDTGVPMVFAHGNKVLVISSSFHVVYTAGKAHHQDLVDLVENQHEVATFLGNKVASMVAVGPKGFYLAAAHKTDRPHVYNLFLHPNPLVEQGYRAAIRYGDLQFLTTMKNSTFVGCASVPGDEQAFFVAAAANKPRDLMVCVGVGAGLDCHRNSFAHLALIKKDRPVQVSMDYDGLGGLPRFCFPAGTDAFVIDLEGHELQGIDVMVPVTAVAEYGGRFYIATMSHHDTLCGLSVAERNGRQWRFSCDIEGEIMQIILDDSEEDILVVYKPSAAPNVVMLAALEIDFRHAWDMDPAPYEPFVENIELDQFGVDHQVSCRDIGPLISEGGVPVTQVYCTGGRRYNIAPHEWGNPGGRNIFEKMPIVGACRYGERHCLLAIQDGDDVDICLSLDPSLVAVTSKYWGLFYSVWARGQNDEKPYVVARKGDDGSDPARLVRILNGLNLDSLQNLVQVFSARAEGGGHFQRGPGYKPPKIGRVLHVGELMGAELQYEKEEKFRDMMAAFERGHI